MGKLKWYYSTQLLEEKTLFVLSNSNKRISINGVWIIAYFNLGFCIHGKCEQNNSEQFFHGLDLGIRVFRKQETAL
jgi:hypothetical protein